MKSIIGNTSYESFYEMAQEWGYELKTGKAMYCVDGGIYTPYWRF